MEVYLNVYDLHRSNQYLHSLGSGFYHSGVEINGYEYSFSDHGIAKTRPQLIDFGTLRDHLLLGVFPGSMTEVNLYLTQLREGDFRPGLYNVTARNCNHFSDAFVMLLLNIHIPSWVNRMANVANSLPGSNKAIESDGSFAAPGMVKEPKLPVKVEKEAVHPQQKSTEQSGSLLSSVFSWFTAGNTAQTQPNSSLKTDSASAPPPTAVPAAKPANPTARKELTEEQKRLLAKLKQKS